MQTKMKLSTPLPLESEQVKAFLTKISQSLKQQRRHFDDAVVTHCIRLIEDYFEEKNQGNAPERPQISEDVGRRGK